MGVLDIFSKRQRRARGEMPDIYQYETLPSTLRAQVVHILTDLFGDPQLRFSQTEEAFKVVHDTLCREYGVFTLSDEHDPRKTFGGSWRVTVFDFFLTVNETEKALDVIEIGFRLGCDLGGDYKFRAASQPKISPTEAVTELNARLRENGVGFQFEAGEIVRVDSQLVHAEIVRPALQLLSDRRFTGANAEFLKAHENYRHGRYSDAMNESLKALESCLKVICEAHGWERRGETAKALLDVVFEKGPIPTWLQTEFTGLRATLEAGVPTARNKLSGHGRGAEPREIPDFMAAYVLHAAAAAILLLCRADKAPS